MDTKQAWFSRCVLLAEVFSGFQYLYNLDLSGKQNGMISLQDLRQMRNLRFLSISRMPQAILSANDFLEFGMDIKELRIINSNLNTIKNHAFMHVRGIKYLDFSENSISTIDDDAFSEVNFLFLLNFLSLNLISHTAQNLHQYRCKISVILLQHAMLLQCCNSVVATFVQLCAIGVS